MQLEKAQLELDQMRNPTPDLTDDMREYQFAKSQGFEGSFTDFMTAMRKAGAASTTVTNNLGQAVEPLGSEGQILVPDPSAPSGYRVEVAEGSKLAEERRQSEEQKTRAAQTAATNETTRSDVVTEATGEIRKMLEKSGPLDLPEVGVIGSRLKGINQEATDMGGLLETLKGMVVFDRLEQLKKASATGASGLGQVTEKEINLLAAQLGALDQTLSKDRILATMDTIDSVFGKLSPEAQAYLTGKSENLDTQAAQTETKGPGFSGATMDDLLAVDVNSLTLEQLDEWDRRMDELETKQ